MSRRKTTRLYAFINEYYNPYLLAISIVNTETQDRHQVQHYLEFPHSAGARHPSLRLKP
jgi:hypothetical protein